MQHLHARYRVDGADLARRCSSARQANLAEAGWSERSSARTCSGSPTPSVR
ncbi:MAG: hypothetical protein IPJ19_14095 [Planctomycetes bacterium]|nr:hypothetical protein [Planctomycetota bacterium]